MDKELVFVGTCRQISLLPLHFQILSHHQCIRILPTVDPHLFKLISLVNPPLLLIKSYKNYKTEKVIFS